MVLWDTAVNRLSKENFLPFQKLKTKNNNKRAPHRGLFFN
jgi:hypothetical protein